MMVKNILNAYNNNKIRIDFLEKQLEFLNNNIDDITAVQFREKAGVTNKVNNEIESKYIKKETEIAKIKSEINFIKYEIELAELFISSTKTQDEKEILTYKYKDGLKVKQIAKKINLSESGVRTIEKKAIQNLNDVVSSSKFI